MRREQRRLADKNLKKESSMVHVTEFREALYDRHLTESYLHGHLGGIPNVNG